MTATLERAAYTPILAVCRDFSCAIYDAVPRQLAMMDALPIHTTSLHLVIAEIARTFEGDIHDGDVYLSNDPYRFNTHVGDLVTAAPVFFEGELLFWTVTKGHQMDMGAFVPSSVVASARNIWQEGLTIPPLKLYDRGRERRDVTDLYLSNMRYRDLLRGDLMAQLGSIEKGRQSALSLCAEYGRAEVKKYAELIIQYADRRMAEEIRNMPKGVFEAQAWVDNDGVAAVDVPIKVRVTINDEDIHVDYSGSGPQAEGGVNGSFATSQAAGAAPFLYYISPDIPHNQGVIDRIKVFAPEGTICNAAYPASTSCATNIPSDCMSDVINKAMATTMPERVIAGSARCGNVPQFSGETGWDGKPWGVMLFNNIGAMGASVDSDGWPLIESQAAMGGMKMQSVEQIELLYPLDVETLEIETDSMGFGRHIGGPGVRMVVRPVDQTVECITLGDGFRNPPHGAAGGTQAIGGGHYVENLETDARRFFSTSGAVRIGAHERYVSVSTGGGGHGDPLTRPAGTVRDEVRDGIVSRAAAHDIFGVVVSDDDDFVLDVTATERRRAELSTGPLRGVEPTAPGAGVWAERNMRPGDTYTLNPNEI
jgi:N-methylhydantoinase B